jgi:hypothetical protein
VKIIIEDVVTIRSCNFVRVIINLFILYCNAKQISLHTEYENPSFADAWSVFARWSAFLFDKCWQVVTTLVEN